MKAVLGKWVIAENSPTDSFQKRKWGLLWENQCSVQQRLDLTFGWTVWILKDVLLIWIIDCRDGWWDRHSCTLLWLLTTAPPPEQCAIFHVFPENKNRKHKMKTIPNKQEGYRNSIPCEDHNFICLNQTKTFTMYRQLSNCKPAMPTSQNQIIIRYLLHKIINRLNNHIKALLFISSSTDLFPDPAHG